MTYDKDIRTCRIVMAVLGALMVLGFVINLLVRNWINAGSCVVWAWACFTTVRSAETHQRSRDETRAGMAELIRAWSNVKPASPPAWNIEGTPLGEAFKLHKDGFQLSTPPLEPDDAAFDAMDKAYGYRSYRCPKCGRLSHLPAEVEPYCIECLTDFKCSD